MNAFKTFPSQSTSSPSRFPPGSPFPLYWVSFLPSYLTVYPYRLFSDVVARNVLGPLVFVTPEIGRFSTVGGIGVMVNELTQVDLMLFTHTHIYI